MKRTITFKKSLIFCLWIVSPDLSSIGTSMPFWIGSPHFYLKENIIVIYVGDNLDTLSIIESVLGS